MNNWHSLPIDRLLEELDARREGLSARQAQDRLARWGPNQLPAPKQASPWPGSWPRSPTP